MDNYELLEPINYGNDGVLILGKKKNNPNLLIIKEFKNSKFSENYYRVLNEINIQKSLTHPNILPVVDHFEDDFLSYLVFPKFEISLNDWIYNGYKDYIISDYLVPITKQLLEGLNYIHSYKLIHRDIKPNNLLINFNKFEFLIVIGDFGNSKKVDDLGSNLEFGTLNYRAPELLLGFSKYSQSIDNWSLGCTLVELYKKSILFEGEVELQVLNNIFNLLGTPKGNDLELFNSFPSYSNEIFDERGAANFDFIKDGNFKDLIKGLVKLNYLNRISIDEALKLDWLKG